MSHDLYIYPAEAMQRIGKEGELDDLHGFLLPADEVERLAERLVRYGYRQTHERSQARVFEKEFGNVPVRVSIYTSEVAFTAPYWPGLQEVLLDIRMDALELAGSPRLAFYDPQADEWVWAGDG